MDRQAYWDSIYNTKSATEVSWFEAEPTTSLALLHSIALRGGRIIDVGGGASRLVDRLVAAGAWEVTVLDVSSAALAVAQARLQDQANRVHWLRGDILNVPQLGAYDVWHDRAVFHFLTAPEERAAYLAQLRKSLRPGGHVVLGTFALQGPEKCSGLPVCRYDAPSLAATLGADFALVQHLEHAHLTPGGKTQPFTFALFQRVG